MYRLVVRLGLPESMRHPIHRFVEGTDELDRYHSLNAHYSENRLYYMTQYWGDADVYAAGVGEMDLVLDHDIVRNDDGTFYALTEQRRTETEKEISTFLREIGVFREHPTVFPVDGDRYQLRLVGKQEALQTLLEAMPSAASVTVEKVERYDRPGTEASVYDSLTERQVEVVSTAVDAGYYTAPREASLEELGERLGIAPGTVSQILRTAEEHIMAAVAKENGHGLSDTSDGAP